MLRQKHPANRVPGPGGTSPLAEADEPDPVGRFGARLTR
jgi:hypothetical protein